MPHEERGTPPKDGFNSGGYKWRVEHWGTKWPAFHVDIEEPVPMYGGTVEVVFHFDTAWSPPTPVIAKAAERFPRSLSSCDTSSAAIASTGCFVATEARS